MLIIMSESANFTRVLPIIRYRIVYLWWMLERGRKHNEISLNNSMNDQ